MEFDRQHIPRGFNASRVADLCLLGALLAVLALAWTGGERRLGASVQDAARVAVQRQLGVPETVGQPPHSAVASADPAPQPSPPR